MPTPPLSRDTLNEAVRLWEQHGRSIRDAARASGINAKTLSTRLQRARAARLTGDSTTIQNPSGPLPVASSFDRRLVALQDENTELRRALKSAARESLDAEKVRSEIIGIAARSPDPPDWIAGGTSMHGRTAGPGTPMVLWSDWHWGERVRPEEVGGVNEFDVGIGRARVRRMVDLIIRLAFDHQVHQGYPGIVVGLGGDMISGEIHTELADTNDLKTMPALVDLFGVLVWALEALAQKFGQVFVPCVVGNHGRATLKPRAKSRVHTSYEWLLYTMLERHFAEKNPAIRLYVPADIDALVRVNNTRYLFTHGDALGVKGGDGIIGALGPILRGAIKTRHSNAQVGRDFDVLVMGHWHQYLPLPRVIVNGSLKGYDEYARTMLRATHERPIQAMWYDHPRIGITKHEPLYLEPQLAADEAASWVSVFG